MMGDAAACPRPFIEILEFDAENGALDAFHAIVETNLVMIITLRRAVFAQGSRASGKSSIICNQRATFAVCAEIFSRVKTEAGNRTERSDYFTAIFGAMRLAGIFDERKVVNLGKLQKRIEVRRMAIKMDRQNSFR